MVLWARSSAENVVLAVPGRQGTKDDPRHGYGPCNSRHTNTLRVNGTSRWSSRSVGQKSSVAGESHVASGSDDALRRDGRSTNRSDDVAGVRRQPRMHNVPTTRSAILQSGSSVHFKTSDAWWRPGAYLVIGEQVRQSTQLLHRDQRWRDTGAENQYWI
jgi:hypothetical protein